MNEYKPEAGKNSNIKVISASNDSVFVKFNTVTTNKYIKIKNLNKSDLFDTSIRVILKPVLRNMFDSGLILSVQRNEK